MKHTLERGQRGRLAEYMGGTQLTLYAQLGGLENPDLSIFGLDKDRILSDDRYFIFYNQLVSPEGAVQLDLSTHTFVLDLHRVPLGIHRLMLAATSDEQSFGQLREGSVSVTDDNGNELLFALTGSMFEHEQAVMLLEIYRHQGEWRIAAVAQGFNGGLAALLQSFGGEVASQEEPVEEPVAAASAATDWDTSLTELSTIFGKPAPTEPEVWLPLESAPVNPFRERDSCARCERRPGLGSRLNHQNLCKNCASEVARGLQNFRTRFMAACSDGVIELREWQDLQDTLNWERLDAQMALDFVRADALDLLERTIALAQSDGSVNDREQEVFERLVTLLRMPDAMVLPLRERIAELQAANRVREGHLPTIESTLILDAGEVAHLETPATFRQVTKTRTHDIPGRLVLTNRQLHFVSQEGGWTVQYGKVLRIEQRAGGVNLELGVKKGSGHYRDAPQPLLLAATLEALVRIHKRLLLLPQAERASRSIPQKVKLEVWQRDQGKCVECGDTNYLEFDHVIPHSLGGATSVGNLQLLCRRCNLAKSNRI